MRRFISILLFAAWAALCLAGCAGSASGSATGAVESYLKALAGRNLNGMIAASCADWEANARLEYDSFTAVTLQLEGLECRQTGGQDNTVQVTCTGSLIANYGDEDLKIDIADRPFQVIKEAGEWRMCGYSQE